jgi:hypothetical protein
VLASAVPDTTALFQLEAEILNGEIFLILVNQNVLVSDSKNSPKEWRQKSSCYCDPSLRASGTATRNPQSASLKPSLAPLQQATEEYDRMKILRKELRKCLAAKGITA